MPTITCVSADPRACRRATRQWVVRYCVRRLRQRTTTCASSSIWRASSCPGPSCPGAGAPSLFQHNAGEPTRTVCSSLIAEAFSSVDFPILPFIDRGQDGSLRFFKRNPRLFTPRDFDYSPYFEIIKYPFLGLNDIGIYRKLPWIRDPVIYNDEKDQFPSRADPGGRRPQRRMPPRLGGARHSLRPQPPRRRPPS